MKIIIAAFFYIVLAINCYAQNTLPKFSVYSVSKEKNQVSWTNPYRSCIQLSIQRSYDSLRFFTTIFSAQSPELPQNGYIDNGAAPGVKVYYRIFYVLAGGAYFFTKSQQPAIVVNIPVISQSDKVQHSDKNKEIENKVIKIEEPEDSMEEVVKVKEVHWVSIYKRSKDSLITKLDIDFYKKYKDSVKFKTKDTILNIGIDEYLIKPFVPKPVWKPSPYLFTNESGYTILKVPEILKHHYKIVFKEENGTEIYTLNSIKEDYLLVEKSNFPHAGWFYYEMYQDGKLFDKNKFFIESDF